VRSVSVRSFDDHKPVGGGKSDHLAVLTDAGFPVMTRACVMFGAYAAFLKLGTVDTRLAALVAELDRQPERQEFQTKICTLIRSLEMSAKEMEPQFDFVRLRRETCPSGR
jgi:hypothetical protein